MSSSKIDFDEVISTIGDVMGLASNKSVKLIPAVLAELLLENDLPLTRKNITNWYNLETGRSPFSVEELLQSTSIPLDNPAEITVITDDCFRQNEAISLPCDTLTDFAKNAYSEIFKTDFVQPSDYIFVSKELKLISLIHHEGEVFEFQG